MTAVLASPACLGHGPGRRSRSRTSLLNTGAELCALPPPPRHGSAASPASSVRSLLLSETWLLPKEAQDSFMSFFEAHLATDKKRFDVERFCTAQGVLCNYLEIAQDKLSLVDRCMELNNALSAGESALDTFAAWQLSNVSPGFCEPQKLISLLHKVNEEVRPILRQQDLVRERCREAVGIRQRRSSSCTTPSESRPLPVALPTPHRNSSVAAHPRSHQTQAIISDAKMPETNVATTAMPETKGSTLGRSKGSALPSSITTPRSVKTPRRNVATTATPDTQGSTLGRNKDSGLPSSPTTQSNAQGKPLAKPPHRDRRLVPLPPVTDAAATRSSEKRTSPSAAIVDASSRGGSSRGLALSQMPVYQRLSEKAACVPAEHSKSCAQLAGWLTRDLVSEEQKAWAVFAWVCQHVAYDIDGLKGRRPKQSCDASNVLQSRLSVCAGYAHIFADLAKHAGLQVEVISGCARNRAGEIDMDVRADESKGHAWNAVYLNKEWILLDTTWGAGSCDDVKFSRRFAPYWFGVPPGNMTLTHFPRDPAWQLLAKPMRYDDFIAQPIVCQHQFFSLGLQLAGDMSGTLALQNGNEGFVPLFVPADVLIMADLEDKRESCYLQRSNDASEPSRLYVRTPQSQQAMQLHVFACRAGDKTYHAVCYFMVTGTKTHKKYVEPCFPTVQAEQLLKFHISFADALPPGRLRLDKTGSTQLALRVPEDVDLLAKLEDGNGEAREATVKRGSGSDVNVVVKNCSSHGQLKVFAAKGPGGCGVSYSWVCTVKVGSGGAE
eukprot:TRINITY_DN5142_c0_g1_i3.p1 TRINITY_DN5142_c0_g1~~TRINITY_DN5142_c0_g1_i3.p1  ORF type:complete len:779 (-),score=121.40 TRINITY_DN5142_c0_g1_i3:481-2817(-)